MKTYKLAAIALLHFCLLFILSGCWNNKDINHRVLPVAMGISKQDKEYKVILKIPEPHQGTTQIKIVSATGTTITQVVDKISMNMESSVDLLHVKVIIIERETAEQGVKDIISGFMRARDVSAKALVVICDEDLDEFFSKIKKTTGPEGTTLFDFFEKNAGWNPQIALTRIWMVYRSIHSYTHDVAIPLVKSGKSTMVEQIGSAVIKNGKMVGEINSDETLLVNAFNGEGIQGRIEVMDHASVLIISDRMEHKSKLIEQKPYLQSQINIKVVLLETRGDPSTKVIKKELEHLLTNRFNLMFTKFQTSKADILGLGQFYRTQISRSQLKFWRSKYYPHLKMDIKFHINIQNEGYLKTSSD
ncbi:Ger(x)C family spore germination protein [Fictibacillus nanhaiensis]|uniref:Ger(x)C family spore germination protein n=1 Tax=Fictibacillus nanhaiensis TaxID=742169 RepID=UPI00203B4956|nr:Ger(x)C family spore germination protein [Fictibacillus nanhaiensis]MCM3730808.1 Ger(x)C family spore germination protein [Fictibacillus nanhaiensis]